MGRMKETSAKLFGSYGIEIALFIYLCCSLLPKFFAGLVVGVEATDVEPAGGHLPSVHRGLLDHIVRQVTRGVLATAVLHRATHQVEVLLQVDVEGRYGPLALGHGGFLLHTEHLPIAVHLNHARALQFLHRGLVVAHNAARALRLRKVHKLLEAEKQQVIGCHNEHIVVNGEFLHCKQQVANRTQAGVVGLGAVIDNSHGLGVVEARCPLLEDGGKFVVGDDYMFVNLWNGVDIIEHTAQNCALTYL